MLTKIDHCRSQSQKYEPHKKQAISAREQALCQLTVCFEFQGRGERRKGHKSCALAVTGFEK